MSIPITLGCYLAVSNLDGGRASLAAGIVCAEIGFSTFGAGVLSLYASDLWLPALAIAGVGTGLAVLLQTVLGFGMLIAFGLIALGWVADLGYTIWLTSSRDHTPVRNGVAVYIAFTGVLVHLRQIVLEAMAESE